MHPPPLIDNASSSTESTYARVDCSNDLKSNVAILESSICDLRHGLVETRLGMDRMEKTLDLFVSLLCTTLFLDLVF